jgi:hypothetical protein
VLQSTPFTNVKEKSYSWTLGTYGLIDDLPPHSFFTEPYSHQIVFIPNDGLNQRSFPYYAYIVSKSAIAVHQVDQHDIISPDALVRIPGLISPTSMTTLHVSGSFGMNETYAYITDSYRNTIKMYRVNANGAALEPLEETYSISTGVHPVKILLSPNHNYIYVVCYEEKSIYSYRINKFSGELIYSSKVSTFDFNPINIQIDSYSEYAFVAANNVVLVYSINQHDGSLHYDEVASKPVGQANTQITGMIISNRSIANPISKLYVTSAQKNELHVLKLNYYEPSQPFNLSRQQVIGTGYGPIDISVWQK